VTLMLSPAPVVCSLVSLTCIGLAYTTSPHVSADGLEMGAMSAFMAVLCATSLLYTPSATTNDGRSDGHPLGRLARNALHATAYFGLAAGARAAASPWHGQLAAVASRANVALGLLMCMLTLLPKPVIPCVACGVLLARPLADLTGQPALLLYGSAFLAQLSQGIAHDVSKQKATLLSHQDSMADRRLRIAFESAHCVFFPNLLLHSCYDSLVGAPKTKASA